MNKLLKVFAEAMEELNIDYDFMEWKTTPVPYPYFVGQYFIDNYVAESGATEGQILLVGWDRNSSFIKLVEIDNKVKKYFSEYKKLLGNNSSVSINYVGSSSEYAENNDLRKIEIRLDFNLWEGE